MTDVNSEHVFNAGEKTNSLNIPNLSILLSSLVAILISLDFDLLDSLSFAVLLLSNIFSGAYLYTLLSKKVQFTQIELFGVGIGLGTISPAIMNFCARLLKVSIDSTALLFPVFMILIFLLMRYQKRDVLQRILPNTSGDFVLILSTPIFALAAWTDSLTPFCIYLAFALMVLMILESSASNKGCSTRARQYLSLLIIPLGSIFFRFGFGEANSVPIWRLLVGVDVAFDEATAFGVSKYGLFDSALSAGQRSNGHVLTHAWAGDFAALTDLPPFMVTASAGFVVGVLGISAMVFAISKRLFQNEIAARLSLVLIFLQASLPEEYLFLDTMRMAHAISIMWLMLFCFLIKSILEREIRMPLALLALLIFAVTLSKVHWGLLAVVIFGVHALIELLRVKSFWPVVSMLVVTITFFLTYSYSWVESFGFPVSFNYSKNFVFEIVGLLMLRLFFMAGIFDNLSFNKDLTTAVAVILFGLLAHSVLAGEYASYYWISIALLYASIFSGKILYDAFLLQRQFRYGRYLTYLFSICFASYACYRFFADNYYLILINASSLRSWFIVSYPELIQLFVVTVAICVGLLLLALTSSGFRTTGLLRNSLSLVITTIFFTNIGFWMVQNQKINILESHYDIQLTSDFVISDTQLDIGKWLESNTDRNSILATNFLCDVTIGLGAPFPHHKKDECLNRNTLTWLASIGHRRVLIEAPLYSGSYIGTNMQIKDYNSSILFGRNMNAISGGYLATRGVDYVIFDKATSRINGLQDFGNVLYENSDYAVIALNELFE
jgi:hypothetical protein